MRVPRCAQVGLDRKGRQSEDRGRGGCMHVQVIDLMHTVRDFPAIGLETSFLLAL